MNIRKPGLANLRRWILPGLLAAIWLDGCALLRDDLQPPAVRLVAIMPGTSTITELGFLCRLRIDNPNDVALPIQGGEVLLTLADRAAARGRLAGDATIPAGASAELDAVVSINVMSAVTIIADLLEQPDAMVPYAIEGYVDVGVSRLGRIRFDERGKFSLTGAADMVRTGL